MSVPISLTVEDGVLKTSLGSTDVSDSVTSPAGTTVPFVLLQVDITDPITGADFSLSDSLVVTAELGFDIATTAPSFRFAMGVDPAPANATVFSRDYATASTAGYFSASVSFVLARGVDYEAGDATLYLFMTDASATPIALEPSTVIGVSMLVSKSQPSV